MIDPVALAREELRRRDALESMTAYRAYMAETGNNDFRFPPARHHELIIAALEKFERGEITRLLIMAPPGSAKSTYASVQFITWSLARNPAQTILAASNSQDLAESFNRRRLNVLLEPAWQVLNDVKLSPNEQSVSNFATEKGGRVMAAGVGTTITGRRSDINVLDDPIKGLEEAGSATQLQKIADWFFTDFRSRLTKDGKELVITTRWAKRDIAGRIIELTSAGKEDWTIIRLPMVCDGDHDPLKRAIGEPLWIGGYTEKKILEEQRNVRTWSSLWQQIPLDESGSWISHANIVYEDRPPKDLRIVIGMDLALSVGKGDWTAFVVCGIDPDRRLWILDVLRERVGPEKTADRLLELCDIYDPVEILVDDDNASKVFVKLLWTIVQERKLPPPPISQQPMRGRDKETRATAIRGLFASNYVRIVRSSWNAELHAELLNFPNGDHDDQVDALSLIGRRFPQLSSPEVVRGKAKDPYEGLMTRWDEQGNSFLNVSLDDMFEEREERLSGREGRLG